MSFDIKIELYHTVSCWVSYDRLHFTQFPEKRKSTPSVDVMNLVQVTTYLLFNSERSSSNLVYWSRWPLAQTGGMPFPSQDW